MGPNGYLPFHIKQILNQGAKRGVFSAVFIIQSPIKGEKK